MRTITAGATLRWTAAGVMGMALILVPFVLLDRQMTSWSLRWIGEGLDPVWTALAVIGLLAADIVLPVPSSLVSTGAGAALGFALGAAASALGMTLSSQLGYLVGQKVGLPVVNRIVSRDALQVASDRLRDRAIGALMVMRSVPVLAEASVVMAGVLRVDPTRFFVSTCLANVGISIAYGAVGALALELNSFLAAFAGAIALPALAWWMTPIVSGSSPAASGPRRSSRDGCTGSCSRRGKRPG